MYHYYKKRLDDRAIDELIGISKGIIADKTVNEAEAKYMRSWMEENVPCCQDEMVNMLYRRIQEMLIDGVLDQEERKELLLTLTKFTGQASPENTATQIATALPFDIPSPPVFFDGSIFCLTGTFAYGPRRICEDVIISKGGRTTKNISNIVDYVVVGYFCSEAWIHSSYGRKIENAMKLREEGRNIAIISEDHWAKYAFNQT